MTQYPSAPHDRTHAPPRRDYSTYRSCLRLEFSYRCCYCLSLESEVAAGERWGGFEIEHFKPKSVFKSLRNSYENLLWACKACNRAKSDTWPNADEQATGRAFVDPTVQALGDHLEVSAHVVVAKSGSSPGQYTIDEIDLNSTLHQQRRRDRAELNDEVTLLLSAIDAFAAAGHDPAHIEELRSKLSRVLARMPQPIPWDAESSCRCASMN